MVAPVQSAAVSAAQYGHSELVKDVIKDTWHISIDPGPGAAARGAGNRPAGAHIRVHPLETAQE
jgi:hypothetical protein